MARRQQPAAADGSKKHGKATPPFPAKQMFVLDFHVTDDASKISVYAGMVTSAFTLAEFATGVFWGRLSDKIGRKPVLLCGLLGTALSVLVFGFAPNLPVALFARALGGLLNGNIGVLQTTVAELVTVKEHQPRAYTIMPMVWCIGSIIGPMVGGALARPCISYPGIFHPGTIWDSYPYLLPNLFSAAAVFVGVVIGFLFLEETHAVKKWQRDAGRELGDRLLDLVGKVPLCPRLGRPAEKKSLLAERGLTGYRAANSRGAGLPDADEPLPVYHSRESSPNLAPRADADPGIAPGSGRRESGDKPLRIFTKPVIMNIMSYGILAFHTMTFDQLFPVFLSTETPIDGPKIELPFKFVSGFGLDTKTIGVIMSVQGLYSLFSNYVIVAAVTTRLGSLRLFRILAFSYFALYLVTPYLVLLPQHLSMPAIYIVVIWKCTYATMAYPNNAILLANSAPTKKVLGTINGVAASTASLCRALGPTVSGFLYAAGLHTGYSGLAWWFSGVVTLLGAYLSSQISENGPQITELGNDDPLLDE
ncbi:Major facilitator superfamily domain, general substrate transporter [Metarhizium album ARSEF 1941]|uniref:Major facilitator superfamily domain, general substrate transporter n=1 Tax=Metarhizium album (strain ARSEF 1941) TaxID=1081103 RepID=A0A0B2WX08_METAS|nr:Major facilitator superfamily domain, general substrate transporter [Metarhizium album ARSEF 1941]KHN98134.1 Major facilitator superfamily domain, general substrate transporter [Metarhizium album ARSEF 1941]